MATFTRDVGSRSVESIDRHERIAVRDFFHEYFVPQRPVILGHLTDGWRAVEKWSFDFFREKYGSVPVTCSSCFDPKVKQPLARYIDYVEDCDAGRLRDPQHRPPLLVDGWYFRQSHRELMQDFDIPDVFANDWYEKLMPERWKAKSWRILLGPKDSFTKLHHDLLRTHGWNTLIRGSKRWVLVAPEHTKDVYIETRQSPGYFPGTDIDAPDLQQYPNLAHIPYMEGVLHAGETIFFPRGWLHQVLALEKSISLAHNYMSANNCVAVVSACFQSRLGRRNM